MKILISIVIVLILGALIGYALFAYDPFGLKYDYLISNGSWFYRIDKFTGETLLCRPLSRTEITCTKVYDF